VNNGLIRFGTAMCVFLLGATLLLDALGGSHLWLLIVAIPLLVVSYPLLYYSYKKWKDGYQGSREDNVLRDAQQSVHGKGDIDAKK